MGPILQFDTTTPMASRNWSATDIPTSVDMDVTQNNLHLWPIVFDHIMQFLSRSYRFVSMRSAEAQKFIDPSEKMDDDAQETLWIQSYSALNRGRLKHVVYTFVKSAWKSYPEAQIHFRTITPQASR